MGFSMGSPATPLKISALPAPAHICFLGLENEHFLGNFRLKCQNGAETSEFQGFLTFGDLYEVPRTTPRSISSPSPRPHMFFENGLCILLLEGPLCARARRLVAKCSWPGKRQQGTYTLLLGYCHTVHVLILNGRRSSITTTLLIVLLAPFRSWLGSVRFVTHSTKALWHNVHEISPHALPAMCAAGSTTQIGGWLTICQL